MANSVDSDETACYEPSRLDLHCLHSFVLVCRAEMVKVFSSSSSSILVSQNVLIVGFFLAHLSSAQDELL